MPFHIVVASPSPAPAIARQHLGDFVFSISEHDWMGYFQILCESQPRIHTLEGNWRCFAIDLYHFRIGISGTVGFVSPRQWPSKTVNFAELCGFVSENGLPSAGKKI